jgi:toxin-antitoxin system PIN domain toxin
VRLLDLNILLYAVNTDSPRHAHARAWLETTMNGAEAVAIPWVVILGFLRLATSRHVFERPLDVEQACEVVDGWFSRQNIVLLNPGPEHWRIFRTLLAAAGTAGNLTTDAHLAALAIEHECELCSTDADFARFPQLTSQDPLRL